MSTRCQHIRLLNLTGCPIKFADDPRQAGLNPIDRRQYGIFGSGRSQETLYVIPKIGNQNKCNDDHYNICDNSPLPAFFKMFHIYVYITAMTVNMKEG